MKHYLFLFLFPLLSISSFSQKIVNLYYGINLSGITPYKGFSRTKSGDINEYEINGFIPLPGVEVGMKFITPKKKSENRFGFAFIYNRTAIDYSHTYTLPYSYAIKKENRKTRVNTGAIEMSDSWRFPNNEKGRYFNLGLAMGIRIMNMTIWEYTENKYYFDTLLSSWDKAERFNINAFYIAINAGLGKEYKVKSQRMCLELNFKQCLTRLSKLPIMSQNSLTITQGWYFAGQNGQLKN